MGAAAPPADPDGDASDADRKKDQLLVEIAADGDLVLDLTFENSPETLRKARKERERSTVTAPRKPANGVLPSPVTPLPPPTLKPSVKVAYRVHLAILKKHSAYFSNLLSNPSFRETTIVSSAYLALASRKILTSAAPASALPWIPITDDDEATRAAGREHAFEDLLRTLHGLPPKAGSRASLAYVATMAIMADRFDCAAVLHGLASQLRFKWPDTQLRPMQDDRGRPTETERVLRQKIHVAWVLGQPMRLQLASRELVMRGSCLWSAYGEDVLGEDGTAAWWNLPDGIEEELHRRRVCILNTLASIQRYFLARYTSRERQCTLGYDSSAACDSFQLGQMTKFLLGKDLLFLVDFSPSSLDGVPDKAFIDVEDLLATLKQCPNYQIDKHHTNCGLRVRLDPILGFIRAVLGGAHVGLSLVDWKRRREDVSWERQGEDGEKALFTFTREMAGDVRLRHESPLGAGRLAKALFTADVWDWTSQV